MQHRNVIQSLFVIIRTLRAVASIAGTLYCLALLAACSGLSDRVLIDKTQQGAVYLERLPNRGATAMFSGPVKVFQATQPILLPTDMLARTLAGIHITSLPATDTAPSVPLFSPSEVAFLAPLLSKAFAQADTDQRVRFLLGAGGEGTAGHLFIHRPRLHFSLDRFRSGAAGTGTHLLGFLPEEASRSKDLPQSWMNVEPERPTVTVDYELLATLAPTPAVGAEPRQGSVSSPPGRATSEANGTKPDMAEELASLRYLVIKQAKELQNLKAELETLRRQTSEQKPAPRRRNSNP
jgi:hypothetical protein